MPTDNNRWCEIGARALDIECSSLANARDNLGESFSHTVDLFLNISGKIVCMGVGKSGHIAAKAASTFSSTGTPAVFIHPTEAGHGDLGLLENKDVVLAISHSGNSKEIVALLNAFRRRDVPLVAIVGESISPIAEAADICLSSAVEKEACPNNLAPTSSTTVALALTDALAVTLLEARGFSAEDFARHHPAGTLGRNLLTRVSDVMQKNDNIPVVNVDAAFPEILIEMTNKRMGVVMAIDQEWHLLGVFTDGDLRRAIEKDFQKNTIRNVFGPLAQLVEQRTFNPLVQGSSP